MLRFEENQTLLFIGDSITDCGRSRENPEQLGNGYVNMTAACLGTMLPEFRLRVLNLGISGNRVCDLKTRWTADCLAQQPDILSVFIGINDTWRRYDRNNPTPAEAFAADYRKILVAIRKKRPGCQIILIEPFVLPVPADRKAWREDLDPKIAAVRELALEFADAYVPLDGIFAAAAVRREPAFWAADGVHPSPAGHMLIAESWLAAAGLV
jgi:lysophospholipase L1-like esterase